MILEGQSSDDELPLLQSPSPGVKNCGICTPTPTLSQKGTEQSRGKNADVRNQEKTMLGSRRTETQTARCNDLTQL